MHMQYGVYVSAKKFFMCFFDEITIDQYRDQTVYRTIVN